MQQSAFVQLTIFIHALYTITSTLVIRHLEGYGSRKYRIDGHNVRRRTDWLFWNESIWIKFDTESNRTESFSSPANRPSLLHTSPFHWNSGQWTDQLSENTETRRLMNLNSWTLAGLSTTLSRPGNFMIYILILLNLACITSYSANINS